MNERYRQEVGRIQASDTFKQQLKDAMSRQKRGSFRFPYLKAAFCTALGLLLLCAITLSVPGFFEAPLPMLKIDRQETVSSHNLGTVGTLGNNAEELAHNVPYMPQEGDVLPVYENPWSEESPYLSESDDAELLPLLETFAKRFLLDEYQIAHLHEQLSTDMLNSNIYLQADIGRLILSSRDSAYLLLSDPQAYDLSGDSQAEVIAKTEQFLKEYPLVDPDEAYIDVSLTAHTPNANRWQIRVSRQQDDPKETLIEQQLNAFQLTLDPQGHLASISCIAVDTAQPLGEYPLKSRQEALQELYDGTCSPSSPAIAKDAQIAYTEVVYGRYLSDAYDMPYYKFYVLQKMGESSSYVPYYVIAVDEEWIQMEE